jgi:hypothetical protein
MICYFLRDAAHIRHHRQITEVQFVVAVRVEAAQLLECRFALCAAAGGNGDARTLTGKLKGGLKTDAIGCSSDENGFSSNRKFSHWVSLCGLDEGNEWLLECFVLLQFFYGRR